MGKRKLRKKLYKLRERMDTMKKEHHLQMNEVISGAHEIERESRKAIDALRAVLDAMDESAVPQELPIAVERARDVLRSV